MELINNFTNLAEKLSAKFPDLDDFYLYIHILGYLSGFNNKAILWGQGDLLYNFYTHFDSETIQNIAKAIPFSLKELSEKERKDLCRYYLEVCLNFEKQVKNLSDAKTLFESLSLRESQAFSKNKDAYNFNFENFSSISQKILVNWEIDRYFYFKTPQTTNSLNKKLVELANLREGQDIYIPNCGIGSILVEIYKTLPNLYFNFKGFVNSEIEWFLCHVNLYVNNIDISGLSIEIDVNSPFENFSEDYSFAKNNEWIGTKFETQDMAISVLASLNKELTADINQELFTLSHNLKPEYAYTELMLKTLSKNGRAIVVVSDEFLHSPKTRYFRERYLQLDWIEAVINVPKGSFRQNIDFKSSIVVFNKRKKDKNFIFFDGITNDLKKTRVRINSVNANNADLRVSQYALKEGKEVESILSKYPQDEIKKIKDLIDSSIAGFNYSPKNRIVENSSETLPYVRVKDLSNNDKDFTLDISKVERKISPEKVAHKRTIINFSAVLISKIAPNLKPTLFNFTGQPIVIGSDVVALKVKEDVNVEYFLTQLYSQLVKKQVEMMSSGTTINRISTQDFLNIKIILPPLEEQQRQVSAIFDVIEEKVIAEEKLIDAQYEVVANINHSLKNKLAVIINDYDTLVRFLRRKERNKGTISFGDPISANAVGDDIDTIEIITDRLKTNLLDASKVFKNAEKIQKQTLKKDVVELVRFFREEVKPLYVGKNYSIDIIAKPNLKLNVWLDKDAFKDVIENLIENAKSHGFINGEKMYRIVFELSKLKDSEDIDEKTSTQYARIIYKNDGKPFPKNFSFEDYKQFSNKAGKTQGTGIGGYVINKMIDLHDGRFNFISPSDDFTVEFEILLPLED